MTQLHLQERVGDHTQKKSLSVKPSKNHFISRFVTGGMVKLTRANIPLYGFGWHFLSVFTSRGFVSYDQRGIIGMHETL